MKKLFGLLFANTGAYWLEKYAQDSQLGLEIKNS